MATMQYCHVALISRGGIIQKRQELSSQYTQKKCVYNSLTCSRTTTNTIYKATSVNPGALVIKTFSMDSVIIT